MNEFKVGLLALATISSVIYMSLRITSNQSGFGEYAKFRTIVKDASGIYPKTPIKVAGINAGRIHKIELQGNAALITMEVLSRIKVTTNSRLKIKTVGFLGDKYLEIIVGDEKKELKEGSLIDSLEEGGIEQLVKDTAEVISSVKEIVDNMKESISIEDGGVPLSTILNDTKDFVANTKELTASLKDLVNNNSGKVKNIVNDLEKSSSSLEKQLNTSNPNSMISEFKELLSSAKSVTNEMQTIISDVRRGKGTLGKIIAEDGIADKVSSALSGVSKMVNKIDTVRTEVAAFTGVNNQYGAETVASVKIFPGPERFYQLGLSTSQFGIESETYSTTVTDDGTPSEEVKKVKEKNDYRFDLQLGRKIHNLTFRGGMIESTGGIGLDWQFNRSDSKVSADVFDYRNGVGVNLRLSGKIQLWNVFYGKIIAEDVLIDDRSFTLSTGLQFNDDDLKGLVGLIF
ncbi:MAG: MCE family protein [Bdellovibrionales bacterium]|nr:MCE family protein [Bdellovibrionales bacterium]